MNCHCGEYAVKENPFGYSLDSEWENFGSGIYNTVLITCALHIVNSHMLVTLYTVSNYCLRKSAYEVEMRFFTIKHGYTNES